MNGEAQTIFQTTACLDQPMFRGCQQVKAHQFVQIVRNPEHGHPCLLRKNVSWHGICPENGFDDCGTPRHSGTDKGTVLTRERGPE